MSNPATSFVSKRNQRFPSVIDTPSVYDTSINIRPSFFLYAPLITGATTVAGWFVGFPQRKVSAVAFGSLAFFGCLGWAYEDSYLRLTGLRENGRELDRYGIPRRELVKITRKRPQNLATYLDEPKEQSQE